MKSKTVFLMNIVLFDLIALLHLLRLLFGWQANLAGFSIPLWLSGVAVVVAGVLAWLNYNALKENA